MTDETPSSRSVPAGCVWSILSINTLIIGLFALAFIEGPYSSSEQELWYRYGSLGFLLGGAILPGIALLAGIRKSAWASAILVVWMVAVLFAFLFYAALSGGGM